MKTLYIVRNVRYSYESNSMNIEYDIIGAFFDKEEAKRVETLYIKKFADNNIKVDTDIDLIEFYDTGEWTM